MMVGLSSLIYGFYLMWRPLGFFALGITLMGIGLLINKVTENK